MKQAFALVAVLVLLSLCTPVLAEAPPVANATDPALLSFLDTLAPTPAAAPLPSNQWLQPAPEGCGPPPEDCGGCYACGAIVNGWCCWVCC